MNASISAYEHTESSLKRFVGSGGDLLVVDASERTSNCSSELAHKFGEMLGRSVTFAAHERL